MSGGCTILLSFKSILILTGLEGRILPGRRLSQIHQGDQEQVLLSEAE